MAAQIYYKLGLCPCGDGHSPFYLSVAKQRLPNAFPGYYSVINSQIPDAIAIRLEPNGHVYEIESDDDTQEQGNNLHYRHLASQNVPKTNKPPLLLNRELKPTILRAVMENPIENPQRNLTPTRPKQNEKPLAPKNNIVFQPTIVPFKPTPLPNPNTLEYPLIKKQTVPTLSPTSTITNGTLVTSASPANKAHHNISQAIKEKPIENFQVKLKSTIETQPKNPPPLNINSTKVFKPTMVSLKPAPVPKPSTLERSPSKNQATPLLRSVSLINSVRMITDDAVPCKLTHTGSLPLRKKKRAPLPPGGVVMSSPFKTGNFHNSSPSPPPPPVPPTSQIAVRTASPAVSTELLQSITTFNRNDLKQTLTTTCGENKKVTFKTGDPLEALRQKLTAIRPAHYESDEETVSGENKDDKDWIE